MEHIIKINYCDDIIENKLIFDSSNDNSLAILVDTPQPVVNFDIIARKKVVVIKTYALTFIWYICATSSMIKFKHKNPSRQVYASIRLIIVMPLECNAAQHIVSR